MVLATSAGAAAAEASAAAAVCALGATAEVGVEPPVGVSPARRFSSSEIAAAAMRATVWSGEEACACSSERNCSARRSSTSFASAWIASMRTSLSGRDIIGSSGSTTRESPSLPSARTTIGSALGVARGQHFQQARHGAFAADLGERVHGALADPPVLVPRRLDERVDRALVLGLVEDLDRGAADVVVLVAHQLQHGVDDLRAADLAERIGGAAAHPPVAVLDRLQQILHRLGVADFVEHLDGGAARVLVLVLEHLDEKTDGVRIVRLDDDVDRLVLDVDLRIPQQRTDALDVDRPSMRCNADSVAPRISLFGSFSRPCSVVWTSGVLNRASRLMMCTRAMGSLPCTRPSELRDRAGIDDLRR